MPGRLWLIPVLAALGVFLLVSRAPESDGPDDSARPASPKAPSGESGARSLALEELGRYPHDRSAFTQGLLWHGGKLYESTGKYGQSRLRRIDLESGEIEQEVSLSDDLFGEGLALVGSGADKELVWLTWNAGRALRWDLASFAKKGEFSYEGKGWGLCAEGEVFYRTDGTATLWTHAVDDFRVLKRQQVRLDGKPVHYLNELECTREGILANVWHRDEIVRIDPTTGRVNAVIDASRLLPRQERSSEAVLNGIAWRPETDTLLVTGKLWPWIFEVALAAAE